MKIKVNQQPLQLQQDWIDKIRTLVAPVDAKKRKTKLCRIKVDGKFVTLASGKTVWAGKGHAKNALKNHFGHFAYDLERNNGWDRTIWPRFVKELESQGILEFVEVDE